MFCSENYSSKGFGLVSKGLALHLCPWLQQGLVLSEKEIVPGTLPTLLPWKNPWHMAA